MKTLMTLMMALIVVVLAGCATTQGKVTLTPEEIKTLSSKENCVLSKDLCRRLVANSNELKLTPEEMQVLKSTGKVVLCGKCGHLLNSLKYKKHKLGGKKIDDTTGFAQDSIRHRILGPYTD